jgi:phosphocarrier protein HPr
MKSFRYKITDYQEMFESPAGQLVRKALTYASAISVSVNDRFGNAKRILSVMALGLAEGDEVLVEAEGPDEARAVVDLAEFFKNNL